MRISSMIFGTALLLFVSACGGSGASNATGPGNNNGGNNGGNGSTSNAISVGDDFFSPASTTVVAGTTVTWTWGGSIAHNVTFADGTASNTQTTGTFTRTFNAAGTYSYHCTIHGTAMSGSVTVQ